MGGRVYYVLLFKNVRLTLLLIIKKKVAAGVLTKIALSGRPLFAQALTKAL